MYQERESHETKATADFDNLITGAQDQVTKKEIVIATAGGDGTFMYLAQDAFKAGIVLKERSHI